MYQRRVCLFALGVTLLVALSASAAIVPGKSVTEYWFGGPIGASLSSLTTDPDFPNSPASAALLDGLDQPDPSAWDYFGQRIRAWIIPPGTGDYTFWAASDDDSQVWLSTDDTEANKALICGVTGWGNYQDWTGTSGSMGANFKSAPITLQAGQRYYVEVLHVDGTGGGACSVGWAGPGIDGPTVVTGAYVECDDSPMEVNFKAKDPNPASGSVDITAPLFTWTAGESAAVDSVYFGTNPTPGAAEFKGKQSSTQQLFFYMDLLEPGATYYWRVDTTDTAGKLHTGNVWSFTVMPVKATVPSPADGATWLVYSDETLSWKVGQNEPTHDLYIGTDKDAVAAADNSSPLYKGNLADATFDTGALDPSTTYYWRVDELDSLGQLFPGDVWSFTTTQQGLGEIRREVWWDIGGGTAVSDLTTNAKYAGPADLIENITSFHAPANVADNYGQRLSALLHVPTPGDYTFWIASDDNSQLWFGTTPGKAQLIAQVSSWTGDNSWDSYAEQKSKTMTLEAGVYFIQALHKEGGGGDNCSVAWEGPGIARDVIGGGYCEPFVPLWAMGPTPSDGAVNVAQTAQINWVPGVNAAAQDIYFGTDAAAVAAADQSAPEFKGEVGVDVKTFDPGTLDWNTTYYWRIDEINAGVAGSPWIGAVWSFRVANFLVIDLSQKTLSYDNTLSPFFSELAYMVPADWVSHGETSLSLRFQGAAGPAQTGSTTIDGPGAYTLVGAGSDIWNNSDQFQYAYMTLTGDGSITAKVESCEQKDVWSKGGVMIRQSAAADSTYVIEAYNAGGSGTAGGTCFQWRATTAGGAAAGANGPGLDAPVWVKLVRTGDVFTGFTSTDGATWTQQGDPMTVTMTDPVLIGLEYTSHVNATTFGTAVFSNVSTTGNVDVTSANNVDVGLGNSAQPIYVAVQDADGKLAVVANSNASATMLTDWTAWEIPLSAFVGVDLSKVAKLSVGVGNSLSPKPDGTGVINIDSVCVVSAVDVTKPGDEVHGIPESDVCGGDSSVNVSPCAELPANVIDDNVNTKYLNFKGNFNAGETACGFTVVPSVGATVVTGMTFSSANDAPERDPTAFELYGSNDAGATWTLIASGPISDFAGAVAWPRLTKIASAITFANDVAYTEYKVLFTALRNVASANSMQIAEVELLGSVVRGQEATIPPLPFELPLHYKVNQSFRLDPLWGATEVTVEYEGWMLLVVEPTESPDLATFRLLAFHAVMPATTLHIDLDKDGTPEAIDIGPITIDGESYKLALFEGTVNLKTGDFSYHHRASMSPSSHGISPFDEITLDLRGNGNLDLATWEFADLSTGDVTATVKATGERVSGTVRDSEEGKKDAQAVKEDVAWEMMLLQLEIQSVKNKVAGGGPLEKSDIDTLQSMWDKLSKKEQDLRDGQNGVGPLAWLAQFLKGWVITPLTDLVQSLTTFLRTITELVTGPLTEAARKAVIDQLDALLGEIQKAKDALTK